MNRFAKMVVNLSLGNDQKFADQYRSLAANTLLENRLEGIQQIYNCDRDEALKLFKSAGNGRQISRSVKEILG